MYSSERRKDMSVRFAFAVRFLMNHPIGQEMGISSYVTGALLMGQMAHDPHTLESHILRSGWFFASFILAASFTAQLASLFSAEREEKRVRLIPANL